MSETKIGVEFYAKTDAAVAATKKLSDATREQIDASDLAGKSQKELGREVQRTRALQLESADANRKAADAQRVLNVVVSKFGATSKEARESAAKLTQAQQEAARAGTAVAVSLEKVTRAVTEVARAENGNLSPATKRLAAQLDRMGKDAERAATDLHKLDLQSRAAATGAGQLNRSVSALSVAGGNLLSSGLQRAVEGVGEAMTSTFKSAIGFESEMADVAKVVDGMKTPAGEATAAYHEMEGALFDLSERIAVAPEGFAEMAAAAGQAGIAGEGLIEFVEDAAKVAVAFDVSADKAGDGLAKLRTGLSLTQPEVRELAGQINVLSNRFAATAAEVLDATQRVGAIGVASNVTAGEMAALATAMISSGASADQAATGTKNFVLALSIGSSATKAQQQAYRALGLEAEAVAKKMTSDNVLERAAQMRDVVERIGQLSNAKRVSVMADLFGKETLGTIGPLATNLELLTSSLEAAADKTAALGSVQAEFTSRSNTTANTLQLLKNSLSVTAITIGNELLPELGQMAKDFSAWVKENRELIKSNVVGFIRGLTDTVKGLAPLVMGAAQAIGGIVNMLGGWERAIGPVVVGLGVLKLASAAALGPWGLLVAGIVSGAMAIRNGMAEAEKKSLDAIRAYERVRKVKGTEDSLASASNDDLIRMKAAIEAERQKNRVIQGDMRGRSPELIKRHEAERKLDMEAIIERERLIDAAVVSRVAEIDATKKVRLETEATAAAEQKRVDKLKMELDYLNSIGKLSAAQKARKQALERGGIESAAPTGGKKGGSKKAKAKDTFDDDLRSFNVEMEVYAAKQEKQAREDSIAAQQAAWDEEERLFEKKELAFDRELEMIEARGMAEEEAQAAREALIERRLDAEHKFAKEQAKMAKTDAQREKATTKLEAIEHQRRLANLRKAHAAEEAAYAQKVKVYEAVTGHVNDLGSAMVDAAWDAAEGQKGAGLQALGDYLKMVSRKATIDALMQTAEGFAAIAGITTAWKAPGHFLAAGKAAAVAVAAGAAGVGLSKAGEARAASGESSSPTMEAAANTSSGYGGSGETTPTGINPTANAPKRELEAVEVPISYFDPSQAPASSSAAASVINIDLSRGTWLGAKGPEDAAQRIQKVLRQGKAAGQR